ncbi:MAG: YihY/virulence factor BrkB family protein [Actinobacteria bacterium]|nr:YihY/virulence factor BrkB family protein [Actinomycetota bacterium]
MAQQAADEDDRGRRADRPGDIPGRGWKDAALRVKQEVKRDNVALMAAGVAFYAMLALFPALIALVTVYGLVADPAQVQSQMETVTAALPEDAASVLADPVASAAGAGRQSLTLGLVVSLLAVLWSASGGVGGLITGVNAAYDESDERNFIVRKGLALLLTLGAIVFVVVAVIVVAVLPAVLGALGLASVAELTISVLRWPLLALLVMLALAVVYRVAPHRDSPRIRWVTPGAAIATVLWLLGSGAFSLYVSSFGSYNETYGALAGVIILLLWLFLSSFVVLLGAEINAEAELQTRRDTTPGPERPMGERDAYAADNVSGSGS